MRAQSLTLALLFFATTLVASPLALAQPMGEPGGGGASPPPAELTAPAPPPMPDATTPPPPPAGSPAPQNAALEAVQTARALPLAEVISRNGITDQVIAASLFPVNDRLVYRLKLLSATGQLSVLFFYADTGATLEES